MEVALNVGGVAEWLGALRQRLELNHHADIVLISFLPRPV